MIRRYPIEILALAAIAFGLVVVLTLTGGAA